MSLHLYDTATREVRDFTPLRPGEVGIYHCGLTVQSPPHIGHIRKEVVYDVLRRWLERSGYNVTVVANVTDIDDKVLAKSAEQGIPWFALAYANERELHKAYDVLGCRPPTYEPRATGVVPEMLEMIDLLIERGHAYVARDGSGDVYFDVRSWPAYGELSRQRIDDMSFATDADPRGKHDPRDFALWKGAKVDEPPSAQWPTPYGRGRPGWHLECSAMAGKYLGDEFDIHGGGLDLRFPHHENELAQSRAVGRPFARWWMHNAMVNLAGEKMSKSVGNTLLVREVVKRVPAVALRYYLATPHYRSIIEFSEAALEEAAAAYARLAGFVQRAVDLVGDTGTGESAAPLNDLPAAFVAAMDDDLGVPQAIAIVHNVVRDGNAAITAGDLGAVQTALSQTRAMLDVLGLDPLSPTWSSKDSGDELRPVVDALVAVAVQQRQEARARKDFAAADSVRDGLRAAGILLEDTPTGTRWTLERGN